MKKRKYVRYAWKPVHADIVSSMITSWRTRLMQSITKSNAIVAWVLGEEARQLKHYQDMSIELDMIHEYLIEERIYRG